MFPYYKVVLIDEDDVYNLDNLIALCPECAKKHLSCSNEEDVDELVMTKIKQRETLAASKKLSEITIEQTISEVLDALINYTDKKLIHFN